jgi:hypothetical protein
MFLRNPSSLTVDYTVSHPRRQKTLYSTLWEPQAQNPRFPTDYLTDLRGCFKVNFTSCFSLEDVGARKIKFFYGQLVVTLHHCLDGGHAPCFCALELLQNGATPFHS